MVDEISLSLGLHARDSVTNDQQLFECRSLAEPGHLAGAALVGSLAAGRLALVRKPQPHSTAAVGQRLPVLRESVS